MRKKARSDQRTTTLVSVLMLDRPHGFYNRQLDRTASLPQPGTSGVIRPEAWLLSARTGMQDNNRA